MCFALLGLGAAGASAAGGGIGLGSILKLIGLGVTAASTISAGNARASQLEAQANLDERQAVIERQRGSFEAERTREKARRLAGDQVAAFAASGVQIDGSAGNVIDDSAAEAALEVGSILYGAELRSGNQIYSAQTNRVNARQERSASRIAAIAPVIRGATKINWGGLYA